MKKLMKLNRKIVRAVSMSLAMLLLPASVLLAQTEPPPPGDGVDPGVPIDGALLFLLAVGIAYGAKKIYESKMRKAQIKK